MSFNGIDQYPVTRPTWWWTFIAGTSHPAVTKTTQYAVQTSHVATKSVQYVIVLPSAVLTKSVGYGIKIVHPLTKSVAYNVGKSYGITKSVQYAIVHPLIQKNVGYEVLIAYTITPSVTSGTVPLNVTFAVSPTPVGPIPMSWNYGDANKTGVLLGATGSHQFVNYGDYVVTLYGGMVPATSTILHLVEDLGPIAMAAVYKHIGALPLLVDFYDHSVRATTYDWDFDDAGVHSSSPSPSHTFASPGTYEVTLTVTNPHGVDITTQTVVVTGLEDMTSPTASFEVENESVNTSSHYVTLTVTGRNGLTSTTGRWVNGVQYDFTKFKDTSVGDIKSWEWDFGDQNEEAIIDPTIPIIDISAASFITIMGYRLPHLYVAGSFSMTADSFTMNGGWADGASGYHIQFTSFIYLTVGAHARYLDVDYTDIGSVYAPANTRLSIYGHSVVDESICNPSVTIVSGNHYRLDFGVECHNIEIRMIGDFATVGEAHATQTLRNVVLSR